MKRLKHTFITFDMNKIVHHSKNKKKRRKKIKDMNKIGELDFHMKLNWYDPVRKLEQVNVELQKESNSELFET